MYGKQEVDGLDLLEYLRVIGKWRWVVIGVLILSAVLSAGYSRTIPNTYRAEVVITPVGDEGGGRSKSFGGLGGLASMAGISLGGGSGNLEVNLAILQSREFLWAFVKEANLKQILFEKRWDSGTKSWRENEPDQWAVYRKISSIISVSTEKNPGLIKVAVDWTDANQAAMMANDLVVRLNNHLRKEAQKQSEEKLGYLNEELSKVRLLEMRQALFELITQEQKRAMLASTQKEFAFRILDAAVAPDMRSSPNRKRIVIMAMLLSLFFTLIGIFVWEGILRNKRKDTAPSQ